MLQSSIYTTTSTMIILYNNTYVMSPLLQFPFRQELGSAKISVIGTHQHSTWHVTDTKLGQMGEWMDDR